MSAKTPILIAAMNRKGGIGKTTLVRALTSAIVHAGKSVLLIDTDPNRALISWQMRAEAAGFGSPLMSCKETLDMDALNSMLDEAFEEAAVDFIIIDTQGGGGVWADTIAAQVQIIVAPVILARTDVEDSLKSFAWYQRLREDVNVLKRGQAIRFEEALQEATYVLNELLAEDSGVSFKPEAAHA